VSNDWVDVKVGERGDDVWIDVKADAPAFVGPRGSRLRCYSVTRRGDLLVLRCRGVGVELRLVLTRRTAGGHWVDQLHRRAAHPHRPLGRDADLSRRLSRVRQPLPVR